MLGETVFNISNLLQVDLEEFIWALGQTGCSPRLQPLLKEMSEALQAMGTSTDLHK